MNPYSRAKLVQNHSIFSSFLPLSYIKKNARTLDL